MIQFIANENVPRASITRLREAGFNIVAIAEEASGISDQEVMSRAHTENRIIITFDRDYGELIYRYHLPKPAGLIYFRFAPLTPEQPAELLLDLWQQGEISFIDMFTIIHEKHIRQRPL